MFLLSRILEKLDQLDKRIDKIETRVEEIAETAGDKMPGQAGHDGQAWHDGKKKSIRDYIRVPERGDEILAQLHRWIDKTYRVKALVYIKAAKEARVLEHMPYDVAALEFPGHLGSQSLYYEYIGEPFAFVKDADIEEFERAKAILKSLSV